MSEEIYNVGKRLTEEWWVTCITSGLSVWSMAVVSPGPVLRYFSKAAVVFLLEILLVHRSIDNIRARTHHQYRGGSGYGNERIR